MAKYTVTLWRYETLSSSPEVEADTPAAAIETAREWAESGELEWDHCGHQLDVDRIEAAPLDSYYDPASLDCAEWTDPKSSDAIRDAAAAMLASLKELLQEAEAVGWGCAGYTDNAKAAIRAAQVAGIEPNAAPIPPTPEQIAARAMLAALIINCDQYEGIAPDMLDEAEAHRVTVMRAAIAAAKAAGITAQES